MHTQVPLQPKVTQTSEMPMKVIIAVVLSKVTSFALLCIILVFSTRQLSVLRDANNTSRDFEDLTISIKDLYDAVSDCESSQRGFILTGAPRYLEPYQKLQPMVPDMVRDTSRRLTSQGLSFFTADLAAAVGSKLEEMREAIFVYQNGTQADAIAFIMRDRGRELMMRIRSLTSQIIASSKQQTEDARRAADKVALGPDLLWLLISLFGVMFLGTVFIFYINFRQQRETATKLEHLVTQAESAGRVKNTFLASVSHEIRTPMNGVIAVADELTRTPLNEDQRGLVDILLACARSMMRNVDDILLYSKMEAGKLTLVPETVIVRGFLANIVALVQLRAKAKRLQVKATVDESVPTHIFVDQQRLSQILTNLMDNAIKFTDHGFVGLHVYAMQRRAVDLKTCTDQEHPQFDHEIVNERKTTPPVELCPTEDYNLVIFEVFDSGIGISENSLSKLFQPFQQALTKKQLGTPMGGTGLGLMISAELVHLMGGQITVRSQPGRGSCFSFGICCKTVRAFPRDVINRADSPRQPCAPSSCGEPRKSGSGIDIKVHDTKTVSPIDSEPPIQLQTQQPSPPPPPLLLPEPRQAIATHPAAIEADQTGRQNILVAEDNALNQKLIERQLSDKSVRMCSDGKQAVDAYTANPSYWTCIFMDVHMPVMHGLDATREIRKFEATLVPPRRVPIIAITAGVLESEQEECIKAGMDSILMKPILREALEAVLASLPGS